MSDVLDRPATGEVVTENDLPAGVTAFVGQRPEPVSTTVVVEQFSENAPINLVRSAVRHMVENGRLRMRSGALSLPASER